MGDEMDPVSDFMRQKVWAVVGASRDPEKYGNRILVALLEAGYDVYPINPGADEVAGRKAYPDLASLPVRPEVVDTVVPPRVTLQVVKEAIKLGIPRIWMQPGSESEEAIALAEANGIAVVHDACAMATARRRARTSSEC
jgi:predicted CoA-binding protein